MTDIANPHRRKIDELTGFEVGPDFERFDQRNDVYCRSEWDESVRSAKSDAFYQGYSMPNARARNTDGFSQRRIVHPHRQRDTESDHHRAGAGLLQRRPERRRLRRRGGNLVKLRQRQLEPGAGHVGIASAIKLGNVLRPRARDK